MIELDFKGIGARIARYRKMNGLSAEKLAEQAGSGLTRSIIANIENGRRHDIGIGQLFAIAWALKVAPTALLLPLDRPSTEINTSEGPITAMEALSWLRGWTDVGLPKMGATPATLESGRIMLGLRTLERERKELARVQAEIADLRDPSTYADPSSDERRLMADEDYLLDRILALKATLLRDGVDVDG